MAQSNNTMQTMACSHPKHGRIHVTSQGKASHTLVVNAHFQSGVAERRIRDLQETAQACLLHAQHRWKEAVNSHLWPYAVRTACSVYNEAPTKRMKRCPCEVFSGSKVMPNPNAWMPFGALFVFWTTPFKTTGKSRASGSTEVEWESILVDLRCMRRQWPWC